MCGTEKHDGVQQNTRRKLEEQSKKGEVRSTMGGWNEKKERENASHGQQQTGLAGAGLASEGGARQVEESGAR